MRPPRPRPRTGERRPRPDRAQPDRAAPHRDRTDSPVQLPPCAPRRRDLHPPPRGHRCRPLDGRVREGHPRRPALAGPDLGRGPGGGWRAGSRAARPIPPDGAPAVVRRGRAAPACRRPRLSVLLHARGARRGSQGPGSSQAAATLRRPLRAAHPGGAPGTRGRGSPRRPALPGRRGRRRLRRHRPRPHRDRCQQSRRRLRHRPGRRDTAVPLHGRRSTTRRWTSPTSSAARTTCRTRRSTSCCSGRSATSRRASPTCRSSSTRTGRR